MNNNRRDQTALLAHCKGVFSAPGWINHGTPEDPLPYSTKSPERDNFRGKQFSIQATKTGKLPSSCFDPKHKYLAEGEQYVDRWPYAEQQPEKQLGFGTGDYSKRDEFCLNIRTEQYRQQLRHENKVHRAAEEKLCAKTRVPAPVPELQAKKAPPLLFDLVFNKHSEFCEKVEHDTLNPTSLSRERDYGPYKTMSLLAHAPPGVSPAKPQHVHRPAMKGEFFRRTNVFFPGGCAAEPQ